MTNVIKTQKIKLLLCLWPHSGTPRSVSSQLHWEPQQMLYMLETRFTSNTTARRISVLASIYTKRFNGKENEMPY